MRQINELVSVAAGAAVAGSLTTSVQAVTLDFENELHALLKGCVPLQRLQALLLLIIIDGGAHRIWGPGAHHLKAWRVRRGRRNKHACQRGQIRQWGVGAGARYTYLVKRYPMMSDWYI